MIIKGVQKTTLVDYPGKVASTIFLYGCNLRCPFCFSPDLVLGGDSDEMSEEEVLSMLKKRKKYIDAVCVTGGEPTLNKKLPAFLSNLKKLGFSVKLDTNGTNPGVLKKIIDAGLVDYIAMDIKAPMEKYEAAAGTSMSVEGVKKSVDLIKNSGVDYEFRTTVVPRLHKKEDILAICRWLAGSKRYYLQQFRPLKTLEKEFGKEKPYTPQQMKELAGLAKPFFETCEVRNL